MMPVVVKKTPEDSQSRHMGTSFLESTRRYARGQQVKMRLGSKETRTGHIVDFGIQDVLPLYWVKIEGSSREVLMFESELG